MVMKKEFGQSDKIVFQREWNRTCLQVRIGLKKLGHDIPLAGYDIGKELKDMTKKKSLAGIK